MAHRRRKQASVTPNSVAGVGPDHSQITPRAASAPGVSNSLGRDEDPSPLNYYTKEGQPAYFVPTVDFGRHILFRNNTNLNNLYSVAPTVLYTFPSAVGTEAADVMQWDSKTWLVTVSALEDDTMRSVSFSLSGLINGTSAHTTNHGTIVGENGGKLYGYDSHVFKHPNGHTYLVYSNNISLRIARMTSYNTVTQDTLLVQTYRNSQSSALYNTEAPSTLILADSNGSQIINLAFATGSYRAKDYNTRLMYIDASRNPLNANNWKLVTQPLIQSSTANKAYAPGSGGFFRGPDGTYWTMYGGYDRSQCQGGASGSYPRTIRAQKIQATTRGVLVPITPVSTPHRQS